MSVRLENMWTRDFELVCVCEREIERESECVGDRVAMFTLPLQSSPGL